MKMTRLVAAGLALASLGLSASANAQGWDQGSRAAQGAGWGRDAGPPPPRAGERRFDDRRFDDRGPDGRGFDGRRVDDRGYDGRFDDRRFADRGRRFDRDRRWGRDDRGGYRDRCWIEHRRGGRVTVCR